MSTLTIQHAIDSILAAVPGAPFPETVDVLKQGDASQPLTGVAVTFLATAAVIDQAVRLGANLIITHEPTFYHHLDHTDWLEADTVYQAKRALIAARGVVIWRFHDYLHSLTPDSTVCGLVAELGWEVTEAVTQTQLCAITPLSLGALAAHVKARLGVPQVRVVGDLEALCRTVAVVPGAPGIAHQLRLFSRPEVDALIIGEISEWETSEYARDARAFGGHKGLIITGHAASEEPGMRWVIPWLKARVPGVPFHFIPTGSLFETV